MAETIRRDFDLIAGAMFAPAFVPPESHYTHEIERFSAAKLDGRTRLRELQGLQVAHDWMQAQLYMPGADLAGVAETVSYTLFGGAHHNLDPAPLKDQDPVLKRGRARLKLTEVHTPEGELTEAVIMGAALQVMERIVPLSRNLLMQAESGGAAYWSLREKLGKACGDTALLLSIIPAVDELNDIEELDQKARSRIVFAAAMDLRTLFSKAQMDLGVVPAPAQLAVATSPITAKVTQTRTDASENYLLARKDVGLAV